MRICKLVACHSITSSEDFLYFPQYEKHLTQGAVMAPTKSHQMCTSRKAYSLNCLRFNPLLIRLPRGSVTNVTTLRVHSHFVGIVHLCIIRGQRQPACVTNKSRRVWRRGRGRTNSAAPKSVPRPAKIKGVAFRFRFRT
jgi:hypothetical protein